MNPNTREAYGRAVRDFFTWCDENGVGPLIDIEPVHIAAYTEQMMQEKAPQTVKQRLAVIKAVFDFLLTGSVLSTNPTTAVRGPKYSTKKGTTPILMAEDAKNLIRSIPTDTLSGLRDRAIIACFVALHSRLRCASEPYCNARRIYQPTLSSAQPIHAEPVHTIIK